jgi:hypothetical protein
VALGLFLLLLLLITIAVLKSLVTLTLRMLDICLDHLGPIGARGRYYLLQEGVDGALAAMGKLDREMIMHSLSLTFFRHRWTLWPRVSAILQEMGIAEPRIVAHLIRAIDVPELQKVRRNWQNTGRSLETMLRICLDDPSEMISAIQQWWRTQQGGRQKAIEALGHLADGQPEISDKLAGALGDEYGGARWAAGQIAVRCNIVTDSMAEALLNGLGQSMHMVVKPHLLRASTHYEPVGAVLLLAEFGKSAPQQTMPVLLNALSDEDLTSHLIALQTLARWPDARASTYAEEIVPALLHLLDNASGLYRSHITELLRDAGYNEQQAHYPHLQAALNQWFHSFIIGALGRWGTAEEALVRLLRVANSELVQNHAVVVLRGRGAIQQDTIHDLLWLLTSPKAADHTIKGFTKGIADDHLATLSVMAWCASEIRATVADVIGQIV